MDKALYDKGMAMRRKVLGDEYVDLPFGYDHWWADPEHIVVDSEPGHQ